MWVRLIYKRGIRVPFFKDKEESPGGASMASMISFIIIKAEPTLSTRGDFLLGQAPHGRRRGMSG